MCKDCLFNPNFYLMHSPTVYFVYIFCIQSAFGCSQFSTLLFSTILTSSLSSCLFHFVFCGKERVKENIPTKKILPEWQSYHVALTTYLTWITHFLWTATPLNTTEFIFLKGHWLAKPWLSGYGYKVNGKLGATGTASRMKYLKFYNEHFKAAD